VLPVTRNGKLPFVNPDIHTVSIDAILNLRHAVLRAGMPPEAAKFDGDEEPTTIHVAAIDGDSVVGCATMLRRNWKDESAWQVRGMAVAPEYRSRGIGAKLLSALEQSARDNGYSQLFWCNARVPAENFYKQNGWETQGEVFDIPTAGPHYRMTKRL
jgi:GNAT superfamily N-acetyltransferase